MSQLPSSWNRVPLGQLAEFIMGQAPPGTDCNKEGTGTPFVKAGEFREERPELCEWTTRPLKMAKQQDVFICVVGATCGKINIGIDCAIGRSVAAIRPGDALRQMYLYRFLQTKVSELRQGAAGSAQGVISKKDLYNIEIPLPPLNEQRRIVAKLDSLLARSRQAREELARVPRLVERYKQAVLAKAFRGELTANWRRKNHVTSVGETIKNISIPPQPRGGKGATDTVIQGIGGMSINDPGTALPLGWAWTPLLRIARQETGHTPSRNQIHYWGSGFPWIGIKDAALHHGKEIFTTNEEVTQDGLDNSSARLLPSSTVCLSRTASVGYITIMGRPMATSQDFATWSCTKALIPKYLLFALMSEGENIRRFGKGSTHTTIYFPEIRAMHIALAPIEEQLEVVRRVESAFAKIESVQVEAEHALILSDRINESILAKAFRGELDTQDPNDESASVLLERLKASSPEVPKQKRGRRPKKSTLVE